MACIAAYAYLHRDTLRFGNKDTATTQYIFTQFLMPILTSGNDALEKRALRNIGYDYHKIKNYLIAHTYFTRYISLCRKTGDENFERMEGVFTTLGNLYTRFGEYKQAEDYHSIVYKMNRDSSNWNECAKSVINLAIILYDRQQYDSAISLIREMLTHPEVGNTRRSRLFASLCKQYVANQAYDTASKALTQAMKYSLLIAEEDDKKAAKEDWLEAGYAYAFATGRYDTALHYAKQLLNYSDPTLRERGRGKRLKAIGDCYRALQQPDTALRYYHASLYTVADVDTNDPWSLPAMTSLRPENTIIEALDAKAAIWIQRYDTTKDLRLLRSALSAYDCCFMVERKLMQLYSYDESRLQLLRESRSRSEKAIGICYQLYQPEPENKWNEKAFAIAEANKAFVLLEAIKRSNAVNTLLKEDSTYRDLLGLQFQLTLIENTILNARNTGDNAALTNATEQKQRLTASLTTLQTSFAASNTLYRKEMEKEDTLSLNAIRSSLSANDAVIAAYFIGDHNKYIFIIDARRPLQLIKADTALSQQIKNFLPYFTKSEAIINQPIAYRDHALALYRQLGIGHALATNASRLIVIPDWNLSYIPFEALVNDSTGNTLNQFAYLVRKHNITYGYSLATLFRQRSRLQPPVDSVFAFAPVFAGKQRGLTPLPNTLTELDGIEDSQPQGRYFRKEQATIGNFKAQLGTSGILHIATHAGIDTNGIHPPNIEFFDDALNMNELYAQQLQTSLVVLSACETGIGQLEKSEGPMSLARAFYYAGARQVITSLWRVDDRSTAALFGYFYRHLKGNEYNNALQEAKIQYLQTAEGAMASPYYWAPFVQIGYMPQQNTNEHWWLWGVGSVTVMAIIGWFWRRKRIRRTTN